MKQKALKLILSGAATLALAVSLTATTFAYVLIGNNVTVEEFDFKVEGQEGLMISLDGENFSQDITGDQLKAFIAGSVEEFDKNSIVGTTVKHEAGNAVYNAEGKLVFEKEQINYDKDLDKYSRTYITAANTDYIAFPLYFKALNTLTNTSNYNLSIGENTYIKAPTDNVELVNSFSVWKMNTSGKYERQDFNQGQLITQNVANAMRLAIVNEEYTSKLQVFEVTDSDDLGSAAINGYTDLKHDPYSSIMINYYNKIFPLYPFSFDGHSNKYDVSDNELNGVTGAEDGEAFNTIPQYGTKDAEGKWTGQQIGSFTTTDVQQVMVYIWLEGWDADYLLNTSVEGSKMKCTLEFNLTAAN